LKLINYKGQKIDSNSEEEYSAEFNATNSKESNKINQEENVSEENLDNLNNHHKHHWHQKQGNYKKNNLIKS
jgi:hypothetical protein